MLLAAACAAALAGAASWLRREDWPKHLRLAREGVPGTAVVTAKGLGARDAVHYTYWAGGELHSGVGRAGRGTPSFDRLDVDDDVLVFYAPAQPDLSTLGDPREHLRSQNRLIALGLLLALPAAFWSLARELKRAG